MGIAGFNSNPGLWIIAAPSRQCVPPCDRPPQCAGGGAVPKTWLAHQEYDRGQCAENQRQEPENIDGGRHRRMLLHGDVMQHLRLVWSARLAWRSCSPARPGCAVNVAASLTWIEAHSAVQRYRQKNRIASVKVGAAPGSSSRPFPDCGPRQARSRSARAWSRGRSR